MMPIIMCLEEGLDSILHIPNKKCAKIDYIKPIKIYFNFNFNFSFNFNLILILILISILISSLILILILI